MKYIVVTGGVISGIGKGIISASIAKLIKENYQKKVITIKCDGYLNTDPGTMNPIEHGEVYVMDDGGEVDMDFGHYERFLGTNTKFEWNLTMGKIFKTVIDNERLGKYLGKSVQFVPHVTGEILERFIKLPRTEKADVCIIEIGGTIGDMENMLYVEAVRELKNKFGRNVVFVHLTYVPFFDAVEEQKTKPTQQSVRLLMSSGIIPDFIVGRSEKPLEQRVKDKISLFCNVHSSNVISAPDVRSVYEVPINLEKDNFDKKLGSKLKIGPHNDNMQKWKEIYSNMVNASKVKRIAIAGKYVELKDSYASIIEAIKHASAHLNIKPEIVWVDTNNLSYEDAKNKLDGIDAIIVPGGFGPRGTDGKINATRFARENKIPFLGICYGLQLAVIEYARDICNIKNANSTEIDSNTSDPIITIMEDQKKVKKMGASMRLGSYKAILKEGSIIANLYGKTEVEERHRHRFEVNPNYHKILEDNGLVLSGKSLDQKLVEFIELPKNVHPYFVATQAHPELKSRFELPSPLFYGLIKATL